MPTPPIQVDNLDAIKQAAKNMSPAALAAVRERVLAFLAAFKAPRIIITTGLDGAPRLRMMGCRHEGLTCYLISVKPSRKLDELRRTPRVDVLVYQYDAADPGQEQPLRLVHITGQAEIVLDAPRMRAFPGNAYDARFERDDNDAEIEANRFGVIIRPTRVRVEGFIPGPRVPVYLPIDAG